MHPAHLVLAPWIESISDPWRMPSLAQLNTWQQARRRDPLAPPGPDFAAIEPSEGYEPHIRARQQVPTRADNWHDTFNALCWLAWPQAKSAINQAHCQILDAGGEAERRRRSPARDVLTLLDEGGAVLLLADATIEAALRARDWQRLFIELRPRLRSHARLLLLGHASLDELRQPRLGISAKCLIYKMPMAMLQAPLPRLRAQADVWVAQQLAAVDRLGRGRDYPPLPLLGWPDWHPQGEDPAFYAGHPAYFRPPGPNSLDLRRSL